jgi:hypothetical protein
MAFGACLPAFKHARIPLNFVTIVTKLREIQESNVCASSGDETGVIDHAFSRQHVSLSKDNRNGIHGAAGVNRP